MSRPASPGQSPAPPWRRPAVLSACAYVNESGFGNHCFRKKWTDVGEVRNFRWGRISDREYDRFGRLDPLCRCAAAAAEMLGLDAPAGSAALPDVGVLLGTSAGSLAVDLAFFRTVGLPGGASPMLFSYTLPSSAIGEIAIRHRAGGPNACFIAGPESALLAFWEGVHWVAGGEVEAAVCVGCEAAPLPAGERFAPSACAFLLESADRVAARGATPLAGLHFCPADGVSASACLDASSPEAMGRFCASFTGSRETPELVYLGSPSVLGGARRSTLLAVDRSRGGRSPTG